MSCTLPRNEKSVGQIECLSAEVLLQIGINFSEDQLYVTQLLQIDIERFTLV